MIAVLLAGVAVAGGLPDAPVFERTAPAGCQTVYGVDPGDETPPALTEGGQWTCSYVLVPVDVNADLMLWRTHAQQVRGLYAIRTAELGAEMSEGFQWRDERIADLEKPPPFWQRPGVQRAAGAIEATAALVLGIIVVNHAARL